MISVYQDQDTGINGRDRDAAISSPHGGTSLGETGNDLTRVQPFLPFLIPMCGDTQKELEANYISSSVTGEVETGDITPKEKIIGLLKDAIGLIDEVLDVYDDEIERMNTFSLIDEKIKFLWELRDEANNNFIEVLVLLEVAVKNSHYENYRKNQYKSIKIVLEKINDVFITPQRAKECRKILMDNGIDLFAPIRNWEDYTVEIKKINANE